MEQLKSINIVKKNYKYLTQERFDEMI